MQHITDFVRKVVGLFGHPKAFNAHGDIIYTDDKFLKNLPPRPPLITSFSDLDNRVFGEPEYNLTIEARGNAEGVTGWLREQGYLGHHVVTKKLFLLPGLIPGLETRVAFMDTGMSYRHQEVLDPESDIAIPNMGVVSGHIHYEGGGIHYIRRNGNYRTLA